MSNAFHQSVAIGLAALLCSCAATSVQQTWKSPDSQGPVGKIAVLAIVDNGKLRQGFENRLVTQLEKAGAPSFTTYDQLTLPGIKEDKRTAADRLAAGGAQALLMLRLADSTHVYREVAAGDDRYVATATGFDTTTWYNYYSVEFMNLNPTYGSLKQKLYVETSLYDLKTEKRVWSGLTKTVLKEHMDRIGEMDPLVEKIVEAMQKDGVIR